MKIKSNHYSTIYATGICILVGFVIRDNISVVGLKWYVLLCLLGISLTFIYDYFISLEVRDDYLFVKKGLFTQRKIMIDRIQRIVKQNSFYLWYSMVDTVRRICREL